MGFRVHLSLLVVSFLVFVAAAQTNNADYIAMKSLKDVWKNTPPNWVGVDPCGSGWDGIGCTNSRITSITLSSMQLTGQLSGDIQYLTELQTLDLSYNKGLTGSIPAAIGNMKKLSNLILVGCGFSGRIPDSLGDLEQLVFLSLNSNSFTGEIPPSIGRLLKLYWLDLADNKLTGTIPVSSGTTPGLDLLLFTKHFHLGKNQLSGSIPPQLFSSNMELIHLLLEDNQLTGNIPTSLGLAQSLEVVRLDRNSLSGPVPINLNNLTNVNELYLSNNKLTGLVPNLTGMDVLYSMDMSNNTFTVSDIPPWFTTLQSLTTLVMDQTQLGGAIPSGLFSLPQLQTVSLKNNQLNGTMDIGTGFSKQLQLIDLQNNNIDGYTMRDSGSKLELILIGNPVCNGSAGTTEQYCMLQQPGKSYSTPPNNCVPPSCSPGQISSPNCKCANAYTGNLVFRAPSFSNLDDPGVYPPLLQNMMVSFESHELPVDSVSVSNPTRNSNDYLVLDLQIFPSGQDRFNRTGVSGIGFVLSNQTFKPPKNFGPFFFIGDPYHDFAGGVFVGTKSSNTGIVIGAAVGGSVLVLLLLLAGFYAYRQKIRGDIADKHNNPFASWDPNQSIGGIPQLKGARNFSFEELKKYANNFSESNDIGNGGYGKVYRGTLPTGELIAIKRAQQGSMQGGLEFKTEIELLSRVHHKNVVSLVGFCFEQGEQILVYEYVPNGTLRESLSGKSGIRMDWMRRLRVALGAARGLHYLHELADPPIIHRDVKSNNVLLDERLNAKVADFGLSKSKPMGDADRTHITTQVKGTMGYMDPEYYMTNQLTEKSDVYSFGVLLLELITSRSPIEKGKYIVREVRQAMDKTKDLSNLQEIIDPILGPGNSLKGLERFVDLAMSCVEETGSLRPTMSEVVKEIEFVMQMAGLNPNAESATSSATYDSVTKGSDHPYSNEGLFAYSGAFPPSKLEPL